MITSYSPTIQRDTAKILASMEAAAAEQSRPKTVNEMTPDERFRFEYSLAPAQLQAEGFSEDEYIAHRRRDWEGIAFPSDTTGADHGAAATNSLITSTPGPGQVGSEI